MSFSSTTQILEQGPRNLIMVLTGIADGSGQETLVTKVDVTALSPRCASVKVTDIDGAIQGGAVELFWDALTPVKFAELSGTVDTDYNFSGGITNGAVGKTGNIKLSTVGFSANSTYHLRIRMVKKY